MQRALLCVVALVGICNLAQAQDVARAAEKGRAVSHADWLASKQSLIDHRSAIINQTMQNIAVDLNQIGASLDDRVRIQASLHSLPTSVLELAPGLTTTMQVQALATGRHGALPDKVRAAVSAKLLGDLSQDLIFIPHGPCRIVDTRFSPAGPITGNTSRAFANFNAAGQGAAATCNDTGGGGGTGLSTGSGGGIALTVTGVPPGPATTYGNQSFLTARPVGSTNVTATVLIEFGTPFTASNSLALRTSPNVFADFEIFAGITSHVVVDLLGFYVPPAPTALDCVTTASNSQLFTANSLDVGLTSPACPAGYTVVSGTCGENARGTLVDFQISGNAWVCRWDIGSINTTVSVAARCCRTPGSTSGRFPT